jgi:hypothetical protein
LNFQWVYIFVFHVFPVTHTAIAQIESRDSFEPWETIRKKRERVNEAQWGRNTGSSFLCLKVRVKSSVAGGSAWNTDSSTQQPHDPHLLVSDSLLAEKTIALWLPSGRRVQQEANYSAAAAVAHGHGLELMLRLKQYVHAHVFLLRGTQVQLYCV